MASRQAAPAVVTPGDHAALVTIANFFLMVSFILAVLIRFAIRLGIAKTISSDDWVSFGSMVAGLAQVAAVAVGVRHGLGKKEHLLRQSQSDAVAQAEYAADLFYLIVLGLSKVSVLVLLRRLCVNKTHQKMAVTVIAIVAAWTIAGIVTLAARCGRHLPWSTSNSARQCISIRSFWIGMLPVDLLTELFMLLLPVIMMRPVHVARSKKATIVAAFSFRLLLVIATIVRIPYVVPYIPSSNFTFSTVNNEILNSVVLSLSITTACIPCLKPFLDAFDSGQMAVVLKRGPGSGTNSYALRDLAYGNSLAYGHEMKGSGVKISTQHGNDDELPKMRNTASVSSDTKSDEMIIKKNVEYSVKYEANGEEPEEISEPTRTKSGIATSRGWRRLSDEA